MRRHCGERIGMITSSIAGNEERPAAVVPHCYYPISF